MCHLKGAKGWPCASHRFLLIGQPGGQRARPQGNVTWAVCLCGSEGGGEGGLGKVSGIEEGFARVLLGQKEGKDTKKRHKTCSPPPRAA